MKIEDIKINWCCRFHPTDSFHEVGCPHKEWSKEELYKALIVAKQTVEFNFESLKKEQI